MPGSRTPGGHTPDSRLTANLLRHTRRVGLVLSLLALLRLLATGTATADPSPGPSGDDQCEGIPPELKDYCTDGNSGGSSPDSPLESATDPLGSLAKGCAEAAAWVVNKLASAVNSSTQVDFTNTGFLRQYAVVFAASSILTIVLWLLAVTKRAVRGVPLHEAFTEAIGFLWLTVVASAFTPLALYTVVKVTDGVTEAIAVGTKADTKRFLGGFADALDPDAGVGGGPVMLIVVSLISILAAAVVWLELLIRAAMLYVGALLGTAVYSGLVDKKLWPHVRRWAGVMIAVDLLKPVIIIVLGLAGAVSSSGDGDSDDAFSAILSGLAILFLAIFASVMIYRFVPGFGDDMAALHNNRGSSAAKASSALVTGPANFVRQGIRTHATRNSASEGAANKATSGGVSSGIAAHSNRNPSSNEGGSQAGDQ